MAHLEEVTAGDLRSALDGVEDATPAVRLVAAIAYKHGVSQTALAEWLGVERKTVYNWLTRLEGGKSLVDAARDDRRPGRPRKLAPDQQRVLEEALSEPPTAVGYDSSSWSPGLLREYVAAEFGEEYSLSSCRRLLNELG